MAYTQPLPTPPASTWKAPKTYATYFYAYSIKAAGIDIGTFERFSQRSTRTVERIREIKAAAPIPYDMVWTGTDTSLELNRVELFDQSLMMVFGAYGSLDFLTIPVDVEEVLVSPADGKAVRTITFEDCVVSDYGKELSTGQARIVETMTVQVRAITVAWAGGYTPNGA